MNLKYHIVNCMMLCLSIVGGAAADQVNEFRPYIEFYKMGKEGGRMIEYQKFQTSEVSKKYFTKFSAEYENLVVYAIKFSDEFFDGSKPRIKILKIEKHEQIDGGALLNETVEFFKKSFPENVKRIPSVDDDGLILAFSGKKDSCLIFMGGIMGPEFNMLESKTLEIKAGEIYPLVPETGAMSATKPPEYFWKKKANCESNQLKK